MKKKIKIFVVLFIAGFFLFYGIKSRKHYPVNTRLLYYENYEQQDIQFPAELKLLKYENPFSDSISVDGDSFLKGKERLSENLFDQLLNLNIINRWNELKDMPPYPDETELRDYNAFVKDSKQNTALYYCGKLRIGKRYDSYLVLATYGDLDERLSVFRYLFLINVIDDKIKSVSRIAYNYYSPDGYGRNMSARILSENYLLLKDIETDTDMLFDENVFVFSKYNDWRELYSALPFDENGYVKLPKRVKYKL